MTARTAAKTAPTESTKTPSLKIRSGSGIDLALLEDCAALYATVEDTAALLDIGTAALQQLIDDPDTAPGRTWRRARAQARMALRRAQFAQMEKNATLAIYLGKELLGQDGNGPAGPVTFIVDTGIRRDGTETH